MRVAITFGWIRPFMKKLFWGLSHRNILYKRFDETIAIENNTFCSLCEVIKSFTQTRARMQWGRNWTNTLTFLGPNWRLFASALRQRRLRRHALVQLRQDPNNETVLSSIWWLQLLSIEAERIIIIATQGSLAQRIRHLTTNSSNH